MRFRFMGPCATVAKIALEPAVSVSAEYTAFWDEIAQRMDRWGEGRDWWFTAPNTAFAHAAGSLRKSNLAYDTIQEDTSNLPACIVTWSVPLSESDLAAHLDHARRDVAQDDNTDQAIRQWATDLELSVRPNSISAKLYHNAIFIVQFDMDYRGEPGDLASEHLEAIEAVGVALGRALADEVDLGLAHWAKMARKHTEHGADMVRLTPLAHQSNGAGKDDPSQPDERRGCALWVTRSMIRTREDAPVDDVLDAWMTPASTVGDWRQSMRERGFAMEWLRYAYTEVGDGERFSPDAWEAMLFCQYFYAAVERAESETFRILGGSAERDQSKAKRKEWFEALSAARLEAELILVRYRHLRRYASRTHQPLVDEIMEGWDFDALVDNLTKSVTICRENLEQILQRATARSTVWTDLLLFSIGSLAVLDFLIGLSVLGRTMTADAVLGLRDEGALDILAAVARLPMDLLISFGVSVIIVAAIVLYRRRRSEIL